MAALDDAFSEPAATSSPGTAPTKESTPQEPAEQAAAGDPPEGLLSIVQRIRTGRLEAQQPREPAQSADQPPGQPTVSIDDAVRRAVEQHGMAELQRLRNNAQQDPVAFLEAMGIDQADHIQRVTEQVLAGQHGRQVQQYQDATQAELKKLQERLERSESRWEQREQLEAAAQRRQIHEQALTQFIDLTGDAEKYGTLSTLQPDVRRFFAEATSSYLQQLRQQAQAEGRVVEGLPTTIGGVADLIESMFSEIRTGWLKPATESPGEPAGKQGGQPPASGSGRAPSSGSLSPDAAGSTVPLTEEDYNASAMELLDSYYD